MFVVSIRASEPRRFASPFILQFAWPLVQRVLNFGKPSSTFKYEYKTSAVGSILDELRIDSMMRWLAKLHEDTMTHTQVASSDEVPENWLEADC